MDLRRNKYFALKPDAEQSFRRLVAGTVVEPSDRLQLSSLVESGVLTTADSIARPIQSPAPVTSECSLIEEHFRARAIDLSHALFRIMHGVLELRLRPLSVVMARLRSRKYAIKGCEHDVAMAVRLAAAFARSGLIVAPLDQCLPRSIAVAHALLDRRISPLLVIGVRLRPFGAHCWVQVGAKIVNEAVDNVRNFTPILVV